LTSQNLAKSLYDNKRNDYETYKKYEPKITVSSSKKQSYSEFLHVTDVKKLIKTPQTNHSISKMEDVFAKTDRENERDLFEKRLKEKFLKVLSNKKGGSDYDFNDINLENAINHSLALGVILLEKFLNKCIIFQEEELLFNNIYEINQHINDILMEFQRIYNGLIEEKRDFISKNEILSENIKVLLIEKERNFDKKSDNFVSYKNLFKNSSEFSSNSTQQIDFLQNKFNFEKNKLLSENEQLKSLLIKSEKEQKNENLQKELKVSLEQSSQIIKQITEENLFLSNKIINIEFVNQSQKNSLRIYEQDLKLLKEELIKITKFKENAEFSLENCKEKAEINREIAKMQYEEILVIKRNFLDKMEIINKVKENYFSIQSKLVSMTQMKEYPKYEDFQNNFDLLSEINSHFNNSKHFAKNMIKSPHNSHKKSADSLISTENIIFDEKIPENTQETKKTKENADLIHSIDLTKFSYYKPSFFSLIESKYKQFDIIGSKSKKPNVFDLITDTMNRSKEAASEDLVFPSHFIAIIRGILDSKWNEFMYYENSHYYSKFPDFCYSWLGKFEINPESRSVIPSNNQDPDEDRCQFLKHLIHPVIDKHWESITFRDFLEEKSSLDEVYFYLYCRFLMFKSPQLEHSQGKYCFIHYVNLDIVNELIEVIFKSFDEETVNFLKKKLKSKAKIKPNSVLIDSGFVLRIFLEYYRLERKHRFKLLQELFLIKAQNKMYIKYEEFKQIVDSFQTESSDLEKAQLFRECYNVGHGKIDIEIIFLVFSENNFFIKTVKTRLGNHPIYRKTGLAHNETEFFPPSSDPNINKILNDFLNLEPKISEILTIAGSMGLEHLYLEIQNYNNIFKKQLSSDNSELHGKTVLYTYFRFHELLMSIRNYEIYLKTSQKVIKDEEILKTELFFFENVYNCIFKIKNKQVIHEFEMNANARKIQKWVQYRFSRWLKLLYTMFKVQIHHKKINSMHSNHSNSKILNKEKKN